MCKSKAVRKAFSQGCIAVVAISNNALRNHRGNFISDCEWQWSRPNRFGSWQPNGLLKSCAWSVVQKESVNCIGRSFVQEYSKRFAVLFSQNERRLPVNKIEIRSKLTSLEIAWLLEFYTVFAHVCEILNNNLTNFFLCSTSTKVSMYVHTQRCIRLDVVVHIVFCSIVVSLVFCSKHHLLERGRSDGVWRFWILLFLTPKIFVFFH